MQIVVADYAGFCFGVRRAIERALAATQSTGRLYSQGPLIHNRQVVEWLGKKGLEPIDDIDDAPAGSAVMLRTHGVGPSVYARAHERGLQLIDATCPFVARAQKEAARLHAGGYCVLVLGEPHHPEAQAIREHTGRAAHIVEHPPDLDSVDLPKRVGVVCQTTQRLEALQALVQALLPRVSELVVSNTICDATTQRQDAASRMAQEVDVAIVVGGLNSANTSKLAQVCRDAGRPTHHIEDAQEIDPDWLADVTKIGVTAGASTPDHALQAVVQRLCELRPGATVADPP